MTLVPLSTATFPEIHAFTSVGYAHDNEMKPGAVKRYPGIFVKSEENYGKPQLGYRVIKAVTPVVASSEDPYPK